MERHTLGEDFYWMGPHSSQQLVVFMIEGERKGERI